MTYRGGKKESSFWKKMFGTAEDELPAAAPSEPDQAAEELTKDAAPAVEPIAETRPLPVADSVAAPHEEDVSQRAARLAAEEAEKQRLAEKAVAEANRAEAASRRAEKEAALMLAEARANSLQAASAAAQQRATQALNELSAAQQAYAAALAAAEQARVLAEQTKAANEAEAAALKAANDEKIAAARAQADELAAQVAKCRAAADQVLRDADQTAAALEDAEVELRRVNSEGAEAIRRALKVVEDADAEAGVVAKQIEVFEAKLQSEQLSFEKAAHDLADAAEQRDAAAQKVEELRKELAGLEKDQSEDANALQQLIDDQTAKVEDERARTAALIIEQRDDADRLTEAAEQAESRKRAAEELLRSLDLERSDCERVAKAKISSLVASIDQARREVVEKKELYLSGQKEVEQATTALIAANAQARSAKEKADLARRDAKDATVALEMAEKLKAEAVAAKSGDEASALLMGKAEMALTSTIQRTNALREEKNKLLAAADAEASELQTLADQAAKASEQATSRANDMILSWSAAEDGLVKIAASVEAEKSAIEANLIAQLADYDQRITAAQSDAISNRDQAEQAAQAAAKALELWQESNKSLQQIDERLTEMRTAAQRETNKLQAEYGQKLDDSRINLAATEETYLRLEQECDRLSALHEQTINDYSSRLAGYNSERERLHQELNSRQSSKEQAAKDADQLELTYKKEIARISDELDSGRIKVRDLRAKAVELAKQAQEAQLTYDKAEQETAAVEQASEQQLRETEQQAAARLLPLTQAANDELTRVQQLDQQLAQCRRAAEQAVSAAAEKFAERLSAVNEVAVRKVEDEVARLKESSLHIYQEADAEKQLFDQAQELYVRLLDEVATLRSEEERITRESEQKYQFIASEKDNALTLLDNQLAERRRDEQEKRAQTETAAQRLQAAAEDYERRLAAKETSDAELRQVEAETTQHLAELDAEYNRAVQQADAGRPELLQKRNQAAEALEKAEAEAAAQQQNYAVQTDKVRLLQDSELSWPKQAESILSQVRAEQQALINEAQTELAALEEKEAEHKAAYAKSSEYAERSEQAMASVEQYLQRLRDEEVTQRDAAEREIAAITARLNALRADADAKEQTFRSTEKTLLNSSVLIEEAENASQNAQIAAAKALAELQAAQAARETALSLSQQAGMSLEGVDKATADIMRRAADDLFTAAENASALVAAKERLSHDAEAVLAEKQAALDSVRQAVGEAPQMLELSRSVWQSAEADYRKCKNEADTDIPAIRSRLNVFITQRRSDLAAAEEKAQQCREEVQSSQSAVEKLSRQLMDIAAAISLQASRVQAAELAAAEKISAAEADTEKKQAQLKADRQEEERIASHMLTYLTELQSIAAEAKVLFATAEADYQRVDSEYHRTYSALNNRYQQDLEQTNGQLAEVRSRANEAKSLLDAAVSERQEATAWYQSCQTELDRLTRLSESKAADCEEMRRIKERMLSAAEEEKLRELGTCTIARIECEEKLSRSAAEQSAKRLRWEAAARKVDELEQALQSAELKMQRIKEESARAISDAERTAASLMAQVEKA